MVCICDHREVQLGVKIEDPQTQGPNDLLLLYPMSYGKGLDPRISHRNPQQRRVVQYPTTLSHVSAHQPSTAKLSKTPSMTHHPLSTHTTPAKKSSKPTLVFSKESFGTFCR